MMNKDTRLSYNNMEIIAALYHLWCCNSVVTIVTRAAETLVVA